MLEFGKEDDFASGLELCQIGRSGTGDGGVGTVRIVLAVWRQDWHGDEGL